MGGDAGRPRVIPSTNAAQFCPATVVQGGGCEPVPAEAGRFFWNLLEMNPSLVKDISSSTSPSSLICIKYIVLSLDSGPTF